MAGIEKKDGASGTVTLDQDPQDFKTRKITAKPLDHQEDYAKMRDSGYLDRYASTYYKPIKSMSELAAYLGKEPDKIDMMDLARIGFSDDELNTQFSRGAPVFLPVRGLERARAELMQDAATLDEGVLVSFAASDDHIQTLENDYNQFLYDTKENDMFRPGEAKTTKVKEGYGERVSGYVKSDYGRVKFDIKEKPDSDGQILSFTEVDLPWVTVEDLGDKISWQVDGKPGAVRELTSSTTGALVFDKLKEYLKAGDHRYKTSKGVTIQAYYARKMSKYFKLRDMVADKPDGQEVGISLKGFLVGLPQGYKGESEAPKDFGPAMVEIARRGWFREAIEIDFAKATVKFKDKKTALEVLERIYKGVDSNFYDTGTASMDMYLGLTKTAPEKEHGVPIIESQAMRGAYEMLRGGGEADVTQTKEYTDQLQKYATEYLQTKVFPERKDKQFDISEVSTDFKPWGEKQEESDITNYRFFKLIKVNGKILVREISNGVVKDTVSRPFEVKFLGIDDEGNLTGNKDYKKVSDVELQSDEEVPSADELRAFFLGDSDLLGTSDAYMIKTVDDAQLRYFLHPDYVYLSNSTKGALPIIRIPKAFTRYPDDPQATAEAVDARSVGYKEKIKKRSILVSMPLSVLKTLLPFAFKEDRDEGVKAFFTAKEIEAMSKSNSLSGLKGTKVYRDEDEGVKWVKNAVTDELEPALALRLGVTADTLGEMARDLHQLLINSGYPADYLTNKEYSGLWLPKMGGSGLWALLGIKDMSLQDLEDPNTWIGPKPESLGKWFLDEEDDDQKINFNGVEMTRKRAAFLVVVMAAYSGQAEKIDLSPAQLQDVAMDAQLKSQDMYMNDQSILQIVLTLFTMWMFGRLNAKATKAMSDAQMLAGVGGKEPDDYVKEYGEDYTDKIGTKNTGIVGRFDLVRRMASALLTRAGKPGSVLLTGPAGTGKTVVVKYLVELTNLAKMNLVEERSRIDSLNFQFETETDPVSKKELGEKLSRQRELVFRIEYAQEQIPQGIRNRRYITLDPAALTAGASFVNQEDARVKAYFEQIKEMEAVRKEFRAAKNDRSSAGKKAYKALEDRLFELEKKFIDRQIQEASRNGESLVIVIDESHNLSKKAWEYLKPGLADGKHQVIAITTDIESKIIKDIPAMERRFEEIPVLEMDKDFVLPLMSIELDRAYKALRNGDEKNQADFLLQIMGDDMSEFKPESQPEFFSKAYELAIYYFKGGARPSNTDQFIAAILKAYYLKWQSNPVIRELSAHFHSELVKIQEEFISRYRVTIPFIKKEMVFFPKNLLFLIEKYRLARGKEILDQVENLKNECRAILNQAIAQRKQQLKFGTQDATAIFNRIVSEFNVESVRYEGKTEYIEQVIGLVSHYISQNPDQEFSIQDLIDRITVHKITKDGHEETTPDKYNEPVVQGLKSLLPRIIERARQIRKGGLQDDALEAQLQKEGFSMKFNFTVDKIDDYIREHPPTDFEAPANEVDRTIDTWVRYGITRESVGYTKEYRRIRNLNFATEIARVNNIRAVVLFVDRYLSSTSFLNGAPNGEAVTESNPSRQVVVESFMRFMFDKGEVTEAELNHLRQVLQGKSTFPERDSKEKTHKTDKELKDEIETSRSGFQEVVGKVGQTATLDSTGKIRRLEGLWTELYGELEHGGGIGKAIADGIEEIGEALSKKIVVQKYDFQPSVFKTRLLEFIAQELLTSGDHEVSLGLIKSGLDPFFSKYGDEFFTLKNAGEIAPNPVELIPAVKALREDVLSGLDSIWESVISKPQGVVNDKDHAYVSANPQLRSDLKELVSDLEKNGKGDSLYSRISAEVGLSTDFPNEEPTAKDVERLVKSVLIDNDNDLSSKYNEKFVGLMGVFGDYNNDALSGRLTSDNFRLAYCMLKDIFHEVYSMPFWMRDERRALTEKDIESLKKLKVLAAERHPQKSPTQSTLDFLTKQRERATPENKATWQSWIDKIESASKVPGKEAEVAAACEKFMKIATTPGVTAAQFHDGFNILDVDLVKIKEGQTTPPAPAVTTGTTEGIDRKLTELLSEYRTAMKNRDREESKTKRTQILKHIDDNKDSSNLCGLLFRVSSMIGLHAQSNLQRVGVPEIEQLKVTIVYETAAKLAQANRGEQEGTALVDAVRQTHKNRLDKQIQAWKGRALVEESQAESFTRGLSNDLDAIFRTYSTGMTETRTRH